MTDPSQYVSDASQALLRVVEELSLHPLDPSPLERLVERCGHPRDRVYRACRNLEHAGWAERTASGWRLRPRITRLSERMRIAIADAHRRYLT